MFRSFFALCLVYSSAQLLCFHRWNCSALSAPHRWRSAYLDFAGLKRLLFDVLLPALEASNGTRRNFTIRQHVSTDAPLGSPLSVLSQRTMRLVFGDPSGRHNDPSGRNMHDASACVCSPRCATRVIASSHLTLPPPHFIAQAPRRRIRSVGPLLG